MGMHIDKRSIFYLEHVKAIVGHSIHFFKNKPRISKNWLILEDVYSVHSSCDPASSCWRVFRAFV